MEIHIHVQKVNATKSNKYRQKQIAKTALYIHAHCLRKIDGKASAREEVFFMFKQYERSLKNNLKWRIVVKGNGFCQTHLSRNSGEYKGFTASLHHILFKIQILAYQGYSTHELPMNCDI